MQGAPHLVIGAVDLPSMTIKTTIVLRQVSSEQIVVLPDLRHHGRQLSNHPFIGTLQFGNVHHLIRY